MLFPSAQKSQATPTSTLVLLLSLAKRGRWWWREKLKTMKAREREVEEVCINVWEEDVANDVPLQGQGEPSPQPRTEEPKSRRDQRLCRGDGALGVGTWGSEGR